MEKTKRMRVEYRDNGKVIFGKFLKADLNKNEIYYLGYTISLTKQEGKIFKRICEERGKPVSATRILDDCFPGQPLTRGNINVHICNINKKAYDIGERDIIISVYGRGYKVNPEH